jgi:hypothetical protein
MREGAGRPEKPIDWDLVDELITKQNSGAEIASHFNLHPETFYSRVQQKWSVNFTNYAGSKYSHGKSLLRNKQWDKAMEGEVRLLLRLGEIHLDQIPVKEDQTLSIKIIDATSHNTEEVQVPTLPG